MRPVDLVLRYLGVILFWTPFRGLIRWVNGKTPKVLLYHACEPNESDFTRGLRSVTPPDVFEAHLDYLSKHYSIVDVRSLELGRAPDRAVAITFDDGYRSVYQHAFPRLRARRIPATVYLVTSVVGNDHMVWVNELNYMLRRHHNIAAPLAAAVAMCRADSPPEFIISQIQRSFRREAVDKLLREIRAAVGIDYRTFCRGSALYLTWDDVSDMAEHGISFGSHSNRHSSLPQLAPEEIEEDLRAARAALAGRPGAIMSFAYPFGNTSPVVRGVADGLGYQTIMEVGGSNRRLELRRIARVPLAGHSVAAMFAEMEVVAPIKGWVKRILRPAY